MSLTTLVVAVQLCLEFLTFVTLSSAATSVNTAHPVPASSIVATSIGTTTATVSTSSEMSSKSPSASTTASSANATTSKPAQDKKLIASIPTFDFSLPNKAPKPKVETTCHSKDMCKKLTGVCIHGSCVAKKCSMDISCNCEVGFTGQFCDKNITAIEIKNGKANGNHNTTPTNNSTKKEEVNVKSTAPKSKEVLNGKSKTTAVNELVTDKLTTTTKKTDLANGMTTVAPETKKVLVNGYIDYNLIKSKRGNFNNGQYDKSKNVSDNGKRTESQSRLTDGYNGNGKNKIGKLNEKVSPDGKESNRNTENVSRTMVSGSKQVTNNKIKRNRSSGKKVKRITNLKSKPNKVSGQTSASSENFVKHIFSGKTVNAKKGFKKSSDGSYLKGPEVHVLSDHSVVDIKTTRKNIDKGKRSLVNKQADTVTITATSVEQTQLGVAPAILSSATHNSLKTNKKITPKIGIESSKPTENSGVKTESKISKPSKKTIPKVSKEKPEGNTVKEKPQTIVSTVDIVKRNPVLVTEEAGSVSIPNNTVIEVSPLFANSEIKITIETSNAGTLVNNENFAQNSAVLSAKTDSASPGDRSKKIVQNKKSKDLGRTGKSDAKQANAEIKTKAVSKDSQSGTVGKSDKVVTASQKTTNKDTSAGKRVGASKKSETRKSTKSEILNPIMQLMNIFSSHKFVENVSAVKIEIITKKNSTDVQKP